MLANAFSGTPKVSRLPASLDTPTKRAGPAVVQPLPVQEPTTDASLTIAAEYAALRNISHCPTGMYLTPSAETLFIWTGVFFIHQGYYASSVLRFRVTFPPDYPAQPPSVHFTTDVFHPLVSQVDGALALAPRFSPWRPGDHHIFDVLHFIKVAFKKTMLDQLKESDCFNKEAFRYRESITSFSALALQTSGLSQSPSALYDRDHPHMGGKTQEGVVFRQLNNTELGKLRKSMGLGDWQVEESRR